MIGTNAKVFVHVKRDDRRPVDRGVGDQIRQKFILARCRGENDPRILPLLSPSVENPRSEGRRRRSEGGAVLVDPDIELVDRKAPNRGKLGLKIVWKRVGHESRRRWKNIRE